MKITLGIPTNRTVKSKTVESLLNLVAYSKHDFHVVVATEGYTVAENRNYIVVQALNNGSDYVLFVDDDMTFPADTLEKLFSTEKRIVGVLSYSRMLPLTPTVIPIDKIEDSLFECSEVGGGVLLVDTKVFNEVERPWFAFETHPTGMTKVGEDANFTHKAREKGISVWCEGNIKVGHLGEFNFQK